MTTYVFDYNEDGTMKKDENGKLVMVEKSKRRFGPGGRIRATAAHLVMGDIADYKSTITGETIHGRAHHRRHLKEHGCVEIGTDNMEKAKTYFEKPKLSRNDIRRDVEKAIQRAG